MLSHMQDCAARITASIEYSTILIGSNRLIISTCATYVQVRLLKILCTMRIKRFVPIRHGSISIHGVVSMPSTIRLANTTEVDNWYYHLTLSKSRHCLDIETERQPWRRSTFSLRRFRCADFSLSSLSLNALAQSSNSALAFLNSAWARLYSALADKNSCRAWVYSLLALWKAGLTASNCSRVVRILATSWRRSVIQA